MPYRHRAIGLNLKDDYRQCHDIKMRLHYLMHVPFEGLGGMEGWFVASGYTLTRTRLFAHEALPDVSTFDGLVVMGGPMRVDDERHYAWLVEEKKFIEKAIARDIPIIGVCLGAQLIAKVLGAKVERNIQSEIGWFPVTLTPSGAASPHLQGFPQAFMAFHWHGDTFEIPHEAEQLARSEACNNQAFAYKNVIALQFHLETLPSGAMDLCTHCVNDLVKAPFVQSARTIMNTASRFTELNRLMRVLLSNFALEVNPEFKLR
jgi:GMP synthase-like glutamine amidotransferase